MGGNKGDTSKKQIQHQYSSSSPKEESSAAAVVTASGPPPFISAPLYVPIGATSSSPFEPQFEPVNPKRSRYNSGQWKLLPSSSSLQSSQAQMAAIIASESTPSPTPNPINNPQTQSVAAAGSSSDAASTPPPSTTSGGGQEINKPEGSEQFHHQFRKGKYVSPVWKPNEMLWLARAWRVQYQGGSSDSREIVHGDVAAGQATRTKTRADKDREVAEFLNKHGINRDAKTAGTKWDNMLGEFRKVYEWERGGEKEQVGKSYFRLSPYERKLHRLPASFDEEVFEELSQFMGPRMRSSQSRVDSGPRPLPLPPPPFKVHHDLPLSARTKLVTSSAGGGDGGLFHGIKGCLVGFDSSLMDVGFGLGLPSSSSSSSSLRRIGKIRMTWEESVSLWAEEGEHHRGRVKLHGSSFLNADELTFLDDSMVGSTMESFEDGPLKGFSVDRFLNGQQLKVFGRRKSTSLSLSSEKQFAEPTIRSMAMPPLEFQDPTDYYIGCLRVPPTILPSLFELSWHLQEPPPEDYRFPIRKEVYRDLPAGKEVLFTTSNELLDCRAMVYDVLSSIIRTNPSLSAATATSRDSFIGLWDDCINRVVSKFCSAEMVVVRKPCSSASTEPLQDQWPNVMGFVRNLCLWRGEETDQVREGYIDPSSSLVEKLLWTYMDLPYILGYYAVGYMVTFCALSRSQDRIIRTDLYSVDLSSPSERLKVLVPCFRIAGLLPLLADRCFNTNVGSYKQFSFSDFEMIKLGNGSIIEMTPNTMLRSFPNKKEWASVKETYDILDHRIPHAEYICRACDKDLVLVFKPRGCKFKPMNCEQLVEALMYVTKALVALHDLCFMHRDLGWDKVMRRTDTENEWFVCGFDEAVGAPKIYPHTSSTEESGRHAPEMGRGLHGVKVDVWGVGYLVKTCGLSNVPKMLKELESRCLDQNPEQRPSAADCYHHLLQVQSASSGATY